MITCPKCKAQFDEEDLAFCTQCGTRLRQQEPEPPSPESQPSERNVGLSPESTDDLYCPLSIEYNEAHFYGAGVSGGVELRVRNISDQKIPIFCLDVQVQKLGVDMRFWHGAMKPGRQKDFLFEVRPPDDGEIPIRIQLAYRDGSRVRAFTATHWIIPIPKDRRGRNIEIFIDNSINAKGDVGYGLSVRNQVADLIRNGVVKSVEDLSRQRLEPSWREVQVTRDYELDGEYVRRFLFPVEIVLEDDRKKAWSADLLQLPFELSVHDIDDNHRVKLRMLVLGSEEIQIGRRKDNDIVLRLEPETEENRKASERISRNHASVVVDEDGVFLVDLGSTNGVRAADGKRIDKKVSLSAEATFQFSSVMALTFCPLLHREDDKGRYLELGSPDVLWTHAEKHGIGAIRIDRKENLPEYSYLILYSSVVFGNGSNADISNSLFRANRFRLIRIRRSLWIENLAKTPLKIDDHLALEQRQAMQVRDGLSFRVGNALVEWKTWRGYKGERCALLDP